MKLDSEEVVFHSLSYADQNARVFWWEGELYRAITSERAALYRRLLSEGFIQHLARRNLIIDTEPTELELEGYALVLKHRTVPFVSYCYEWCGEMLRAAAISVLELEKELLKHGLTLEDAHAWNVLYLGTTPVWVDVGSLQPACPGEPWHAYEDFSARFTRPLKIMAAGYERIARCLLRDGYSGVQQRELEAITGTALTGTINSAKNAAKISARKIIPPRIRPFAGRAIRSVQSSLRSKATIGPIKRIDNAIREVEGITLVQSSTDWSNYYGADFPDFASTTDWTPKHRSIAQILSDKKPDSVLDIGSNRGWYSQLAARSGAQVVSVDSDEPAVTKLFFDAVAAELPILALIADFRELSPKTALSAPPGVPPVERLQCEMVLALALVHHLVFTQFLNFDLIVASLSAFAQKWLVIEFVGPDDPYVRKSFSGRLSRFSWYALDSLVLALKKQFNKIELFPSEIEHRRILLCER